MTFFKIISRGTHSLGRKTLDTKVPFCYNKYKYGMAEARGLSPERAAKVSKERKASVIGGYGDNDGNGEKI